MKRKKRGFLVFFFTLYFGQIKTLVSHYIYVHITSYKCTLFRIDSRARVEQKKKNKNKTHPKYFIG